MAESCRSPISLVAKTATIKYGMLLQLNSDLTVQPVATNGVAQFVARADCDTAGRMVPCWPLAHSEFVQLPILATGAISAGAKCYDKADGTGTVYATGSLCIGVALEASPASGTGTPLISVLINAAAAISTSTTGG